MLWSRIRPGSPRRSVPVRRRQTRRSRSFDLAILLALLAIFLLAFVLLFRTTGYDLILKGGSLNRPLVVGSLLLLALAVWVFPKRQAYVQHQLGHLSRTERPLAENEFRRTLIQVLAGVAILLGFTQFVDQLHLQWSAQLADRFTQAVDQLSQPGDDALPTRLGGIYALERIGEDSDTYFGPVTEVLAAYVRSHATSDRFTASGPIRRPLTIQGTFQPPSPPATPSETIAVDSARGADWPPPDILACLTVLGRRDVSRDERPPDLTKAYLRWAQLEGRELPSVSLRAVNLSGALLDRANLSGSDLSWANLFGAALNFTDLTNSVLDQARLDRADIIGARRLFRNDGGDRIILGDARHRPLREDSGGGEALASDRRGPAAELR